MSLIKQNIVANFGGKAWAALVSLIAVPIYLSFLGTEAYGLIGIYASMTGVLTVLDLGLSTVLSREMARLAGAENSAQSRRRITRALELAYWIVAIMIGVGIWGLVPFLASRWVNAVALPVTTVETALVLAGIAIASQWPLALYSGGMIGLERQVQLNIASAVCATVRAVGGILILGFVARNVEAFFAWQAIIGGAQTILTAALVWGAIDGGFFRTRFEWEALKRLLPSSLTLAGIATTSAVVTQIDKIVLVRFVSLDVVGLYSLVATVAGLLFQISGPVYAAFLPRLTREAAQGNTASLARSYHIGCQIVSVLVFPAAAVGGLFAGELLALWTRNQEVAQQGAGLLALLLAGNAASSLLHLPYALQVAGGSVRLVLLVNIASAVVMVPLSLGLITFAGAKGAAWAWLILNLGYVFGGLWVYHRVTLSSELFGWYMRDVLPALLMSVLVAFSASLLMPADAGLVVTSLWIAFSALIAVMGSSLLLSELRGPTLGLAARFFSGVTK